MTSTKSKIHPTAEESGRRFSVEHGRATIVDSPQVSPSNSCCYWYNRRLAALIVCPIELVFLVAIVIGFLVAYEQTYTFEKDQIDIWRLIRVNLSHLNLNMSAFEKALTEEKLDAGNWRETHYFYVRSMAITSGVFAAGLFVIALGFRGVVKGRAKLLIPHMIAQVLASIALLVTLVLYFMVMFFHDGLPMKHETLGIIDGSKLPWVIVGSSIFLLVFMIFSFCITFAYYRFLMSRNNR